MILKLKAQDWFCYTKIWYAVHGQGKKTKRGKHSLEKI